MAAGGSPWSARRVGHATHPGGRPQDAADLLEHRRRSSRCTPAPPAGRRPTPARRRRRPPVLDRWALSEAAPAGRARSTPRWRSSTRQRAGRLLAGFVDDLSNWYVRRSRRRFWDGDPAALATLHECLDVVTRLMAPLVPFVTERVWQDLFADDRGRCRSRCTWRTGRRPTSRSIDADARPSRSPWSAAWSSSAGPPGPSPG